MLHREAPAIPPVLCYYCYHSRVTILPMSSEAFHGEDRSGPERCFRR